MVRRGGSDLVLFRFCHSINGVGSAPSSCTKPFGFFASAAPLAAWYLGTPSTTASSASGQTPTSHFPVSLRSTFKRSRSAHRSPVAPSRTTKRLRREAEAVNQTVSKGLFGRNGSAPRIVPASDINATITLACARARMPNVQLSGRMLNLKQRAARRHSAAKHEFTRLVLYPSPSART